MPTARDARQLQGLIDEAAAAGISDDYVDMVVALRAYGFPVAEVQTALLYSEQRPDKQTDTLFTRVAKITFSNWYQQGDDGLLLVQDALEALFSDYYAQFPTHHYDRLSSNMGSDQPILTFSATPSVKLHYFDQGRDDAWTNMQDRQIAKFGEWLRDRWLSGED